MYIWVMMSSWLLMSCVTTAPIQEMSDARSAVATAQHIVTPVSSIYLEKAKENLEQATIAIEKSDFHRAKTLAKKAKIQAQKAVKEQQHRENKREL